MGQLNKDVPFLRVAMNMAVAGPATAGALQQAQY
jgi:hypothetical protein